MFGRKKSSDAPGRRQSEPEARPSSLDASQFRRNRTLSGVAHSSGNEVSTSTRSKVHDLTTRRRKVGGIFLLVLAAVLLLTLLIFQFTARVAVTSSSEAINQPVDAAAYEELINEYLGVHPAGRLRFVLNQSELSTYVGAIAPEVAKITQTGTKDVIETHFTITFRQPVAGWQINNRQYFVDQDGVVFEKNYYEAPTVQIVDESGISPEQGSTVASSRLLSFVGRVVALSRVGGYEVEQAILPVGTTRQVELRLKNVSSTIKLTIDRGAGEQVEDMTRALRYLSSRGQSPSYVDVRVSGRAAYQ